ncbi:MAG: tRNA epoxyqueuosine(34) reductase QueG [Sphingobacteriia bacterium]|nr:tRNA epoxyqueuosine(34) reductase QueG [Sphingobacteriia bacterium]
MTLFANHSQFIKQEAYKLGFDYCGIAKAEYLNEDAKRLEQWLNKGFNGSMHYMENYFDLRVDPQKIVPGAKSVITVLKNYYPSQQQNINTPKISKYAWGKDYHEVIKQKLNELTHLMKQELGNIHGRGFVDSAPVLERAWANKSGLGWIGRNGNLITKQSGSYFFIATLIVDIELKYDDAFAKDYCGSCSKCIDHCPTEAILPNKVIDGSKCISYFTIELKDELLPQNMKGKFDNWMFGCDVCMDVCPWNRFATPNTELSFTPIPEILNLTTDEWLSLKEDMFKEIFRHSPLKRSKWKGIQRNLKFIQS